MNTIRRFVVFGQDSGFIFGEAYTTTPEEAVSLVHFEIMQERVDFEYVPRINCGLASYYVQDCTDLEGLIIDDGQDQDTIGLACTGAFAGYYKRAKGAE